MNDRPAVIILDYLMKDKLIYWLPVLVKLWKWGGLQKMWKKNLAYRLSNFLSFTTNLLIKFGLDTIIN